MRTANQPRRGFALVVLLVVLALMSVLMVMQSMQLLLNRRMLQRREHQLQATWLARSGVEVAAARLARDGQYTGETLDIIPDASLVVKVTQEKGAYDVSSEARYPTEGAHTVTCSLNRILHRDANRPMQ